MVSFSDLWLRINEEGEEEDHSKALLDSGEESKAIEVVRNGMNLRKPNCGSFWDDFINLCGNSEAMSDLLDVPSEKIGSWASTIREMLSKIEDSDGQDDTKREKVVGSEPNEPVADPNGVDAPPNEPAETRPMP